MMMVWSVFAFLLLFGIMPLGMGAVCYKKGNGRTAEYYLLGLMMMLAVFEVIVLPATFTYISLTVVEWIWLAVCVILMVLGYVRQRTAIFEKKTKKNPYVENPVFWVFVALVVIQIVYITLYTHIDDDDAWYVGSAVVSYFTDTINYYSPYSGEVMGYFPSDYTLAPYPIFWAMVSRVINIHPTIFMHSVVPVLWVSVSYVVYFLLAQTMFKGDSSRVSWCMVFMGVLNCFGFFSVRSTAAMLLLRSWQGKATLAVVIIPLTLLIYICAVERNQLTYWIALFITVLAGCTVSSMGVMLMPLLLGSLGLIRVVTKHDWMIVLKLFVCVLPCVVQGLIYLIFLR